MKSTKSVIHLITLISMLALFMGCGGNSVADKTYGTWEISADFSDAECRKISKEPIPDGVEAGMTLKGKISFHKGGKYSEKTEYTIRYKSSKHDVDFRYLVKNVGEWSLYANGKELVETTTDATVTPLNEWAEALHKDKPGVAAILKPVKGKTITYRILSISDTVMKIQHDELKYTLTLNKKR